MRRHVMSVVAGALFAAGVPDALFAAGVPDALFAAGVAGTETPAVAADPPSGRPEDPVAAAVAAARVHRGRHGPEILREFADLLSIPNVASDSVNIRRNADWITARFAARGARMEQLRVPGAPPVVFGRLAAPGATRTLGIYLHYDGQPAGTEAWVQDPWTPTLYAGMPETGAPVVPFPEPGQAIDPEWRLVARSAGDDKAPILALLAGLDALKEAGLPRTSHLVFFFEGEEEAGSPHLDEYFRAYASTIDVDVWLFCDGPVHQSRRPQLAFGVRGVTGLEITVYGATRGLHSGHYGNWSPNPGLLLAHLLTSMKDEHGRVLVKGFYDSVAPLGAKERAALAEIPDVDTDLLEEFSLARSEGDGTLAERLLLPSLNLRGLQSGDVGSEARNVIPPTATASLDIRLVKGNEPEAMLDLVEAHIRGQGYHIVRDVPDSVTRRTHDRVARVVRQPGYPGVRTSLEEPIVEDLVRAARAASPDPVVLMPSLGGSLPLHLFTQTWNKPFVIVPIANHDDNQHAPNENLRLGNLWYGIDLFAAILAMP